MIEPEMERGDDSRHREVVWSQLPHFKMEGEYRITLEVWATACEVWAWVGAHMDRASPATALKSRTTSP
jgi:hypothetical protein